MSALVEWELAYMKIPVCSWKLDEITVGNSGFLTTSQFKVVLKPNVENNTIQADATVETVFKTNEGSEIRGFISIVITSLFNIFGLDAERSNMNDDELDRFRKDISFVITGHARAHILVICQHAGISPIFLPMHTS